MKHLVLNRLADTEIVRTRQLPFPGQVLVEPGQSVHPEDVIAEAVLPGEIIRLDIARGLGVDPSDVLSCLVRDLGENLEQDDVIAEREGSLARLVRAPKAGRLLSCRDGVAFFAAGERVVRVQAGLIGTVSEVIPERGAVITTQGSLIQGVWGNGGIGAGVLRVQPSGLEKEITPDEIESFDDGQVIALGSCENQSLLESIKAINPTGLILGSINPGLLEQAHSLPFPVMLLQGFGEIALDDGCFDFLRQSNGDVVCINACPPDLAAGVLPETIIPHQSDAVQAQLPFRLKLRVGQRVLVVFGPSIGRVAAIQALPQETARLESGVVCKVAILVSDQGETFTVPQSNLVIVGKTRATKSEKTSG